MELLTELSPSMKFEKTNYVGSYKAAVILPNADDKLFFVNGSKLVQFKVLSIYVRLFYGHNVIYKIKTSEGIRYLMCESHFNVNGCVLSDANFYYSVEDYKKGKKANNFVALSRDNLLITALGDDGDRVYLRANMGSDYSLCGFKWDGVKASRVCLTNFPQWVEIPIYDNDNISFMEGVTYNVPADIYETKEECEEENAINVDYLDDDEDDDHNEEVERLMKRVKANIAESIELISELKEKAGIDLLADLLLPLVSLTEDDDEY